MLTVYKGCRYGLVVTMKIDRKGPNNLGRSGVVDPKHAPFRCRSAMVVGIENVLTGETAEMATSQFDVRFCYRVGEMVEEPEYNAVIGIVNGKGIHFFLTWKTAKFHALGLIKDYTGEWEGWYDNGQRRERGCYKDGFRVGKWEMWDINGQYLNSTKNDIQGNGYQVQLPRKPSKIFDDQI